jgi:hypothetical protein
LKRAKHGKTINSPPPEGQIKGAEPKRTPVKSIEASASTGEWFKKSRNTPAGSRRSRFDSVGGIFAEDTSEPIPAAV